MKRNAVHSVPPIAGMVQGNRAIAEFLGVSQSLASKLIRANLLPTFILAGMPCAWAAKLETYFPGYRIRRHGESPCRSGLLMSKEEVAAYVGITPDEALAMYFRHTLPSVMHGSRLYSTVIRLDEFLARVAAGGNVVPFYPIGAPRGVRS